MLWCGEIYLLISEKGTLQKVTLCLGHHYYIGCFLSPNGTKIMWAGGDYLLYTRFLIFQLLTALLEYLDIEGCHVARRTVSSTLLLCF